MDQPKLERAVDARVAEGGDPLHPPVRLARVSHTEALPEGFWGYYFVRLPVELLFCDGSRSWNSCRSCSGVGCLDECDCISQISQCSNRVQSARVIIERTAAKESVVCGVGCETMAGRPNCLGKSPDSGPIGAFDEGRQKGIGGGVMDDVQMQEHYLTFSVGGTLSCVDVILMASSRRLWAS